MKKKILIITRCSRANYIKDVFDSIKKQVDKCDCSFHWHIGFNTTEIKNSQEIFEELIKSNDKSNIKFTYSTHISNVKTYGANIINEVLELGDVKDKFDYSYVLDDDNILHDKFNLVVDELESDTVLCFGQNRRLRGQTNKVYHKYTNTTMNSSNCCGWIDTAQFVIPIELLRKIGNYVMVEWVDGETIKQLFLHDCKFKHLDFVASHWNYLRDELSKCDNVL